LRWLPPSGFTSPFTDPWLSLRMLILPAIVLGTHSAAVIMRQGRSALMEVLEPTFRIRAVSYSARQVGGYADLAGATILDVGGGPRPGLPPLTATLS